MVAKGSFGAGLNPFGSSQPSGLSQYSIGSQLAQLDAYKAAVGWGNGTVSNDDYLASLQKVLDAALPNSHEQVAAQNALDDAKYSIGRQAAQTIGLDALIAFDQKSLASMRSDNEHAQNVQNSLDSELAQARSRDYSDLVDKVNQGKASTQSLLDWVTKTLSTLPANAPDLENWTQTQTSVASQIQSEKDSAVYQDYNNQRMSGTDFLAYVQSRRDQYDPSSPAYADWSRKLEDATKNVTDTQLAAQDTAFFDAYNEGKKSDADYLGYIKTRLDGMDPSDPQYETWRHRYVTTAFSIAEDQLRFAVNQGTKPVSDLVSFYQSYALTLNPGSAEWRTTEDKITSLKASSGGGGGGGSSAKGGTAITFDKVIDGKYTLDTVLHDLALPANATKADVDMFNANYNRLNDAHTHGDATWLFIDPTKPGAVIAGQNPDGSPMLDSNGQPIMVRGSGYLPVTTEALGNLDVLNAQYHSSLAAAALQKGDSATFYSETEKSDNALDHSRGLALSATQKANQLRYQNAQGVISLDLQSGNLTGAYNTTLATLASINDDLADPTMDATRRAALQAIADKLAGQPFMPQIDDTTGQITGGAIVLDSSGAPIVDNTGQPVVNPGWHFVLADGTNPTNRWVQDLTPGASAETWAVNPATGTPAHITVTVPFMGVSVRGDVAVGTADPTVWINLNGTWQNIRVAGIRVQETQYRDGSGNLVRAYSVDGHTWVTTNDYYAGAPSITLAGTYTYDATTGKLTGTYTDASGNAVDVTGSGNANGGLTLSVPPPFDFATDQAPFDFATDQVGNIVGTTGGGYTARYSPDGLNLDTRDLPKGPVYTTPSGLVVGDYQDSRLPVTAAPPVLGPAAYSNRGLTQPGQTAQDVAMGGKPGTRLPTPAPVLQTARVISQPGQTNQDVVAGKAPPSFALTVGPSSSSLPGTISLPQVSAPPALAPVSLPQVAAPTLRPLAPISLPQVAPPTAPVLQGVRPITQPGQTSQDVVAGAKPPKPPVVVQPPRTVKVD